MHKTWRVEQVSLWLHNLLTTEIFCETHPWLPLMFFRSSAWHWEFFKIWVVLRTMQENSPKATIHMKIWRAKIESHLCDLRCNCKIAPAKANTRPLRNRSFGTENLDGQTRAIWYTTLNVENSQWIMLEERTLPRHQLFEYNHKPEFDINAYYTEVNIAQVGTTHQQG